MKVYESLDAWLRARAELCETMSIGFVPTMGALHRGHAELLKQSQQQNECSVLSIFVNPTQFNDATDLQKYPRTLAQDMDLAQQMGVQHLILPSDHEMYQDGYRFQVHEEAASLQLEGQYRPGHFDGVLTVVLKLLNLVRPARAYFGEKDYQQYQLIRDMCQALFLNCEIVPVPTVREHDGLALSSRNMRLSAEQRQIAPQMYHTLSQAASPAQAKNKLEDLGFKVDYVADVQQRRLAAAYLGDVRLIDNVLLGSEV